MNRSLPLPAWLCLLIGLAGCGPEKRPSIEKGPVATFAKMQAAIRDRDWNTLYSLYLPSERAAAEKRWNAMCAEAGKSGSVHKSRIDGFALEVNQSAASVAAMDLRAFFSARNAAQAKASPRHAAAFAQAAIKSTNMVSEDAAMVRIQVGDSEQEVPLQREGGTWYLARALAALTDF